MPNSIFSVMFILRITTVFKNGFNINIIKYMLHLIVIIILRPFSQTLEIDILVYFILLKFSNHHIHHIIIYIPNPLS